MLSKEQWQTVEDQLKGVFGVVKLRYREHEITVEKRMIAENQLGLAVFINGALNAGWGWETSEPYRPIVSELWRPRFHAVYKPKEVARLEKTFGKRRAHEYFPKLHERLEWYDPYFKTFKSLQRRWAKLQDLELRND